MKTSSHNAFTLIEMLTVMLIITVIAALLVQVAGYANKKAAMQRALGEIAQMSSACEQYKADNGTYPRNADTDALSPKKNLDPTNALYRKASLYLYSELTGDKQPDGQPDTKPEPGEKSYLSLTPNRIGGVKQGDKILSVTYLMDPFGNSYGYSTAAAKAEEEYQAALRTNANQPRTETDGYNSTFDLWSTSGYVQTSSGSNSEKEITRWVKNW